MLFSAFMASALMAGGPLSAFAGTGSAQWAQQANAVDGIVTDANGEPIIGASIVIKGTTNGTITDLDGKFSLPNATGTLVVSYIGYKTQEIVLNGQKQLKIVMQEDSEILEEVVVVGYGTVKKESLTGSVTVVDDKAFAEKGNLSSPLQALQGQVPGVMITRSSSAPGDESWSMNLRGSVSVNSTEPLVIIDGVATNSVNDLRLINPNDIESINFLKDGSAAIYGARAAGGVVLVTTKKGKEGKTKVEYSGSVTLKTVGLMPELMNIDQWADGVMTALENDGNTSNSWYTYAQLAKKYKGTYIDLENTSNPFGNAAFTDVADFVFDDSVDWLGSLFGNSLSTDHNLSISGGTEKASYRLSLGYMYDGSPLQYGNNNNQRYNFRLSNSVKLTDKLSLESVISYNRQEQVSPTDIGSVLTTQTPMPGLPLTNMNGQAYAWGTWGSPVAKVEQGGDNKLSVSSLNISETLNYTINDWLSANANVGYTNSTANRDVVSNSVSYYNFTGTKQVLTTPSADASYYRATTAQTNFYSFSAYLNTHKKFGKHDLSLTLGGQYEFNDYKTWGVKVENILSGLEIVNGSGDVTVNGANNEKVDKYQNAFLSFYGRFNYNYDDRYLLEVNGRYDGSSKFQPSNRWAAFYGISAGWRIKQEAFMEDVDWLSDLKLRVSYAEMGNQSGIGNYDGVQLYNVNTANGAYVGSGLLSYIATDGKLVSTTRHWKKNDDMLVEISYPAVLGDKAPTTNGGKFKGWGYEGQATWRDRIGEVSYYVGGTLTFARNELTDFGGTTVLQSGYVKTQQGYALNSIFGLRYGGKIQNEEQLAAYLAKYYDTNAIGMPSNLRVGDSMYCDENGDGVLDEKDYIYLGSDSPEISYSFNAGVSWKGFDINVIFQGAANRFVYRDIDNTTVPFRANYTNTTTASIGNVWSPENPDAYYAPYTNDSNINNYNYQASSLTAQDGRYLRLKNVTIGYTFDSKLLQKTKCIQGLRLYVTGADLWETTKITDGWDPEAKRDATGLSRYPFTRSFTFGANVTF